MFTVAAGGDHSLSVHRGGTVWGWGNNESGQLGTMALGGETKTAQAVLVGGSKDIHTMEIYELLSDGTTRPIRYENTIAMKAGTTVMDTITIDASGVIGIK